MAKAKSPKAKKPSPKPAAKAKAKAKAAAKKKAPAKKAPAKKVAPPPKKRAIKARASVPAEPLRPKTIGLTSATDSWDPSRAKVLVGRLRARWPSLAADERRAFDSLSSSDERSRLGKRTKARGVANEAARWAVSIDRQLTDLAVVREHYDPKRFSYYLERLDALLVELAGASDGQARAVATSLAAQAIESARATRRRLVLALERFAGKRRPLRTALEAGRGASQSGDDVTQSLRALVGLASMWLESGDAFLLASARLTRDLVAEGRAAAEAVGAAGSDAMATSASAHDSPAVNLAEGWLVEEMARVREDFDAAKEDNDAVRRLDVGPALRNALGKHAKEASPADAAPVIAAARPSAPPPAPEVAPASSARPAGPPEEPLA